MSLLYIRTRYSNSLQAGFLSVSWQTFISISVLLYWISFKNSIFYFNLFTRKEKQKQNKNRKALLSHCHLLTVLSSSCSILFLSVKRQRNLIIREKSVFFYFFNILILFSKHSQNEIYIFATLPKCSLLINDRINMKFQYFIQMSKFLAQHSYHIPLITQSLHLFSLLHLSLYPISNIPRFWTSVPLRPSGLGEVYGRHSEPSLGQQEGRGGRVSRVRLLSPGQTKK